jgi:hypothetical protein
MIRKSILALAAIAALGVVVAPVSDASAKGFQGPKNISNGKGNGPTVHPKGPPKNWANPNKPNGPKKGNWAGPKYGKHGGHGHGYRGIGLGLLAAQVALGPDCYRIVTPRGRIKTVCEY